MLISELIEKLQEEKRKHGNIPVGIHQHDSEHTDVEDVATFNNVYGNPLANHLKVCISTEVVE